MDKNSTAEILEFVVSNGRVLQDEDGNFDAVSFAVEVGLWPPTPPRRGK